MSTLTYSWFSFQFTGTTSLSPEVHSHTRHRAAARIYCVHIRLCFFFMGHRQIMRGKPVSKQVPVHLN